MSELDDFRLGTATAGTGAGIPGIEGEFYILESGKHKAEIHDLVIEERENFAKTAREKVLKVTFRALEGDDDPEHEGKEGVITGWLRITGYQLEDPKDGGKSHLTAFVDNIFGRKLTEDEASALYFPRFKGLKGWVLVSESTTGKPKFGSFRLPKGTTVQPSDFFRHAGNGTGKAAAKAAPSTSGKTATKPKPKVEDDDDDDITNPFDEDE